MVGAGGLGAFIADVTICPHQKKRTMQITIALTIALRMNEKPKLVFGVLGSLDHISTTVRIERTKVTK